MSDSQNEPTKGSLGLLPYVVIPVVLAVVWIWYYQHSSNKILDKIDTRIEQTEKDQKESTN